MRRTRPCSQAFYVFKHKPHERLSIWQVWKRLKAAGLAFHPRHSGGGVFPMIFMPGLRSDTPRRRSACLCADICPPCLTGPPLDLLWLSAAANLCALLTAMRKHRP